MLFSHPIFVFCEGLKTDTSLQGKLPDEIKIST